MTEPKTTNHPRRRLVICLVICAGWGCGTPEATRPALATDPQVVKLDLAVSGSHVLADVDNEITMRLRLGTRDMPNQRRPVLNVVLAIDTSGSMAGEPIERARHAAAEVVRRMNVGDRLGVVVFHSTAEILVASEPITETRRKTALSRVATMKARGTTSMSQGLAVALAQLRIGATKNGVSRLVLLSDGVPNNPDQIPGRAAAAQRQGTPITALGFGLDYDESLLAAIAQTSGGSFHFVEKPEQVAEVFTTEIARLEQLVARNMSLHLTPGPGLEVVEVYGAQLGNAGRSTNLQLGDLSLGEKRDVVVRMKARGRRDGATIELLDAVLSFQDAYTGGGSFKRTAFASAKSTSNPNLVEDGTDRSVLLSAARALAASKTVRIIALARAGLLDKARALLSEAETEARTAAAKFDHDPVLLELAQGLAQLDDVLPNFVSQVLPQLQPAAPISTEGMTGAAEASPSTSSMPRTVRSNHERAMRTLQNY